MFLLSINIIVEVAGTFKKETKDAMDVCASPQSK
jgi:hypothetical protein